MGLSRREFTKEFKLAGRRPGHPLPKQRGPEVWPYGVSTNLATARKKLDVRCLFDACDDTLLYATDTPATVVWVRARLAPASC